MLLVKSETELAEFSLDAGIIKIRPSGALVAESDEDVVLALRESELKGLPVTPRGAGTSIPSQAVGKGIILLQKRNEVVTRAGSVSCGPTIIKSVLNEVLDRDGAWVPPDPSSYQSCTLGGMVANNSSGARTFKYGSTVDYVTQLRVVLPEAGDKIIRALPIEQALHSDPVTSRVAKLIVENQKAIEMERPMVTKNSCGYRLEKAVHDGLIDFPKLFSGSEGTLGVITNITLLTKSKPRFKVLLVVEVSLEDLDRVVSIFRGLSPAAIELVDKSIFKQAGREEKIRGISRTDDEYLVFCELDAGSREALEKALEKTVQSEISSYEPLTIDDPGRISEAWGVRNETLTIATELRRGSRILVPGVEDLVVPPDRLGDLVSFLIVQFESRGLEYISYGHAGDANLHMRPFLDPKSKPDMVVLEDVMEECFEATWKMGGSITGEHGDGMLRAKYVERQYPRTYEIMKQIRDVYDPRRVLNPEVKVV